jgi:rhodanese-related sulfurtransferase
MIRSLVKFQIKLALLPFKVVLRLARRLRGGEPEPEQPTAPVEPGGSTEPRQRSGPSPFDVQLDPGDVLARLGDGEELVFVDIRQAMELAESGTIDGALRIPLQDLPRRVGELDRERPVILYCSSGVRSIEAARFLREKGFARAWSLGGGVARWEADGGSLIEL